MKKRFITYGAQKGTEKVFEHDVEVEADSEEEAEKKAKELAYEKWPIEEGFTGHYGRVQIMKYDD